MALIVFAVLIDKSLTQLATCNPQNRECSCADTSSRVAVFCSLKVFCFIDAVFLKKQLKLRTVRTSFHQRGSMWTTLKNAWPCVRWSASKESQPVHFRYLRKPTMWPLYRRSTPLGSVNGCSSTTAQPRRNWVSFHPTSTVRYKTTSNTTLERGRHKPHSHNQPHLRFRCSFVFPAVCSGRCQLGAVCEHLR